MNGRRTADWLLPWLVSALAVLQLVLVRPSAIPAAGAVALLVRIAWRRRALAVPRPIFWLLIVAAGLWWGGLSIAGDPRPDELLGIAAWYLAILSLLQILSGTGAFWRTWNAVGAVLLAGFHPDPVQHALAAAMLVLVLLQARLAAARNGAGGFRLAWGAVLAAVLVLGFAAKERGWSIPLRGFEAWRPPTRAKGFSSTLRLGGGFGTNPDPSDDDVVLRAWTRREPRFLKGATFDTYAGGYWSRSEGWTESVSSRNHLEFSVFCQVSDTMAPPSGWASPSGSTEGYLLTPPDAGCVGVVADSLEMAGSGIWRLREEEIGRGWMWFPGAVPARVRDGERTLPRPYVGLLDSAFAASNAAGVPPEAALARIGRWLAGGFRYSLQVGENAGEEPLRAFLRRREGYCEHYASLGALLARRAGIPSRVVSGYAYPEWAAGAWIFRRSNAHAWVEVFLPGRGWTTWDPTPAGFDVPPRRGFLRRWSDGFGTRVAAVWHVVRDGSWRSALSDRFDAASAAVRARWIWALPLLFLGVAAFVVRKARVLRSRGPADETERWRLGLERAEARLRRDGILREAGETVGEFLARMPESAHLPSREFLESYQRERWALRAGRKP